MHTEPKQPSYDWGMSVVALVDLINDGSYPDHAEGACLVTAGAVGEIVKVGHLIDDGEPLYLVEFGRKVIGCIEEEIAPAPAGWVRLREPEVTR